MNILSFRTRSTPLFIAIFVLIAAGVSFGSIEDSLNKSFTVGPGGHYDDDDAYTKHKNDEDDDIL